MTNLPRPCLMLVTEPSPRLLEIIREAVAGGVDVVQWREKKPDRGKYRQRFQSVHAAAEPAQVVVNGSLDAALACGARRIHLPEKTLPIGVARWRIGSGGLIGKSVRSAEGARRAEADGPDYVLVGPIFASASEPDVAPAGLDFLREVCDGVAIPVLAGGGVTPENTAECLAAGAAGVAALTPFMQAEDPQSVARAYRATLDQIWKEIP